MLDILVPNIYQQNWHLATEKMKVHITADMVEAFHVFELMNQVASYAKSEGPF